jgi:hypothetical protein
MFNIIYFTTLACRIWLRFLSLWAHLPCVTASSYPGTNSNFNRFSDDHLQLQEARAKALLASLSNLLSIWASALMLSLLQTPRRFLALCRRCGDTHLKLEDDKLCTFNSLAQSIRGIGDAEDREWCEGRSKKKR